MHLYSKDTKLSEILFAHPEALTVLNRFGIFLGVGDATIESICRKHELDSSFMLAILNTYLNESYFPEGSLKQVNLKLIVDYLNKAALFYEQFQLPNIERHFHSLVTLSRRDNNNLSVLQDFFFQMKQELTDYIRVDRQQRFPLLRKLSTETLDPVETDELKMLMQSGMQEIEDKLTDLLTFFIVHLKGGYDHNLCQAVVSAIFILERDIRQNNRIRRRILMPMIEG